MESNEKDLKKCWSVSLGGGSYVLVPVTIDNKPDTNGARTYSRANLDQLIDRNCFKGFMVSCKV